MHQREGKKRKQCSKDNEPGSPGPSSARGSGVELTGTGPGAVGKRAEALGIFRPAVDREASQTHRGLAVYVSRTGETPEAPKPVHLSPGSAPDKTGSGVGTGLTGGGGAPVVSSRNAPGGELRSGKGEWPRRQGQSGPRIPWRPLHGCGKTCQHRPPQTSNGNQLGASLNHWLTSSLLAGIHCWNLASQRHRRGNQGYCRSREG